MENAGDALAKEALRHASKEGRFVILCGPGNNGGDGLVAAKTLAGAQRTVFVESLVAVAQLKDEPMRHARALRDLGIALAPIPQSLRIEAGDVVIDALLGTGLSRAPDGPVAEAIGRIARWREAGAKVVSADLPSGLQTDSGAPFSACVTADVTVAFGFLKRAHLIEPGVSRCGHLTVVDIGIPRGTESVLSGSSVNLTEESDVRARFYPRTSDSHKGSYGHLLVVAGSRGKTGAAALVAKAALRTGVGLVTVATRSNALEAVLAHAPEVMGVALTHDGPMGPADLNALLDAADGKDAVVFGPGIARDDSTITLLSAFLEELTVPCVLDADALNAVGRQTEILKRAKGELLLTPHPGEMARLLGSTAAQVNSARIETARSFAVENQVVLALKGARTVVAREDGAVFVNPTGNPGMATGGTGDVLSGICGALLAQGFSSEEAAICGVYVHGLAGDLAALHHGQRGLIATDLIAALGELWPTWHL
jgi:NAD(P)H-hydrate epimerase